MIIESEMTVENEVTASAGTGPQGASPVPGMEVLYKVSI